MIIDMHTHAGRPNRIGPVDRSVLATMAHGGIAAAVVSAIGDLPMLRRDPRTKRLQKVRDPDPGECLAAVEDYLASFEATGTRIAREPDDIHAGDSVPGDLLRPPSRDLIGHTPDPDALRGAPGPDPIAETLDPALVLAVEGCDFLEGNLDRLDRLEARGVRSIQLTHYLVNETGDVQTAPPVHGGLTPLGADAVRRMNRLGIIVDVAHCSEATVRGVVAATSRPILCSHANLKEPGHPDGDHPRYLSPDYARMVAETGGVIGAWMSVLWEEKLPGLVRHLFRLIDAVGIDHVGIGTDLPAGAARSELPDFLRHHEIAAALRGRGMTEAEVAKVCAGNWLRVFRTVRAQ